jgi:hypothetical protein
MRITMGHPDYVYRPLSQEQRDNMRAAARRRLGIPDGYRRVFGALVDEAHAGGSPARADAPPLPEKTLMPMPYADPAFDDLIVRRVQSTMAVLDHVAMAHADGGSALSAAIDDCLHVVLVEQPVTNEAEANAFAAAAVSELAAFFAQFPGYAARRRS